MCDYLSMLGLKSNHAIKSGQRRDKYIWVSWMLLTHDKKHALYIYFLYYVNFTTMAHDKKGKCLIHCIKQRKED